MYKQILLFIALMLGMPAPVLAMQRSLVDEAFAAKPARVRQRVEVKQAAAEVESQAELKEQQTLLEMRRLAEATRAASLGERPVRYRETEEIMVDGNPVRVETPLSNEAAHKSNKKKDKTIKWKEIETRKLTRQINHEKDILWKSTGALALTIFVCMHMHKHNHIERIAEYYGPMTAHAVQVIATLALGTSAKTMWDAGINAYSKIPQKIKQLGEQVRSTREAKEDPSILTAGTTSYDARLKKSKRAQAPAAASSSADQKSSAAAAAELSEGAGLGLARSAASDPEEPREPVRQRLDAHGKIVEE